jgi:outer membrane protein TolC
MARRSFRRFPGPRRLRWLTTGLCAAGVPLLALGCSHSMSNLMEWGPPAAAVAYAPQGAPVTPYAAFKPVTGAAGGVAQAQHTEKERAKETAKEGAKETAKVAAPTALPDLPAKAVPVNLDSVMKITEENNAKIAVARERVNERQVVLDAALESCVPDLLRKDDFKRAAAEARYWQARAELASTTTAELQDAANAYIDLLTARRGVDLAREMEGYEEKLLRRAENLVKSNETGANILVESSRSALAARRQAIAKLRQQADAAAEKLAFLLNLHDGRPVPPNRDWVPIDLVDATLPLEALVEQARANGPTIPELEQVAAAISAGIDEARLAQRACKLGCALICARLHAAESKLQQTNLTLDDTRGRLTLGVREAYDAILSGREQAGYLTEGVRHARETYRLANLRLEQGVMGATQAEVAQAVRGVESAEFNRLSALSALDKAQVRLLLLIGPNRGPGGAGACPAAVAPPVVAH